ncbi:MAG: antibiotic biosynthesis monooxygenase [Nostoc sp. NMS1]|uniref:putative quinol monooxygenase n=1 Tax=unclassified Nostoc TaxID=2593658 RepID=UPI0025D626F0|nr:MULTISPECIES: antibiotic biosynthesis monooxygenase [unclassified Nostoc]MBN3908482.1 antibiotic biosynthesis monooxygenase [Nostoc sp. NMS1]MBN3994218.1 antibiotic biosynthesis monooxygenase [Nostoc sp. NMS2]
MTQVKLGILAHLEAKPDKVEEVQDLLTGALPMALQEAGTNTWFAIRLGPTTFGIFDTFADEGARQAHLSGKIAEALMSQADKLLASPPDIKQVEILVSKLPKI